MTLETIKWLWAASKKVADGGGLNGLKIRIRFLLAAWREPETTLTIRQAAPDTALSTLIAQRPQMLGAFIWPYQNAAWPARQRWERIISHTKVIDALGPPFTFGADKRLILLDLDDLLPGFKIVLDQPKWFMREGPLAVNIFLDDFRAFSLAFSFYREEDGSITAYIGAMQGRQRKDVLSTYHTLTKKLCGVRPRDFLIEVLRIICQTAGVARIHAVADAYRHHRHAYFNCVTEFTTNYDEIWRDRAGVRIDDQTFALSTQISRRDLADVKPNKRSMYRKRYEFLNDIAERLRCDLPALKPVWFEDS